MSSKGSPDESEYTDQPIKYSSSKAREYSSFDTFAPEEKTYPWHQTVSITLSMSVFMLYFFVLREENDWDEELKKSIYERVPGLEKKDMKRGVRHEIIEDYAKK